MRFSTKLRIVDEIIRKGSVGGNKNGKKGGDEGALVGVVWSTLEEQTDWHGGVPGHVEKVSAKMLAERPEYAALATLGDAEVPTIFLNREYGPLKQYVGARAPELTDRGTDDLRDRYAVGTGLGLLYLDQQFEKRAAKGERISDEVELDAKQAVARSVLTTMPAYEALAKEVGISVG